MHTLGPTNGEQGQIPAPTCVLRRMGSCLSMTWQRGALCKSLHPYCLLHRLSLTTWTYPLLIHGPERVSA